MKLLDLVGFYVLFLVIFSEVVVKCVVGFGRFVRIVEDQWKWSEGTCIFSMFNRTGLCVGLKITFLQINGIAGFQGLNLFS